MALMEAKANSFLGIALEEAIAKAMANDRDISRKEFGLLP
jgi:hypothetical protein